MSPQASTSVTKAERLNIRVTAEEKALVEQAARLSRVSASQFVLRAAVSSAEQLLAEQTRFVLSPSDWERFTTILDRPAHEIAALRELAARQSPFGER